MKEVIQFDIARLNNAMRTLKVECLAHEDCSEECPLCEYNENNIPHCRLQDVPQFWKPLRCTKI